MAKKHSKPTQKLDTLHGVALYDILDNPNGPTYNELWEDLTIRNPAVADKLLNYANECSRLADDPTIAETILLGAVKASAYFDPESDYNPEKRLKNYHSLESLFAE